MIIEKARMEVIDRFGHPIPEHSKVHLDGGDHGLDVNIRRDNDGRTVAEIRFEPKMPELADELGYEGDHVLLDWFMVYDATVTYHGGRLTITGYMAGAEGFRRNGKSPHGEGQGNAYTDDGGPLVRVCWHLV